MRDMMHTGRVAREARLNVTTACCLHTAMQLNCSLRWQLCKKGPSLRE